MEKKARIFLALYIPALMIVSFLTLDRIWPGGFPSPSAFTFNLLPLLGTQILLPGVIVGATVIWILGSKDFAGRFLMVGIVVSVLMSIGICNIFRGPILLAVGEAHGNSAAEASAFKYGEYRHMEFRIEEHIPGMQRFIRGSRGRKDENLLRTGFMKGYNSTYDKRYYDMINRELLGEEGFSAGYFAGLIEGRYAKIRSEPFTAEPLSGEKLDRIKTDFLPDFVEGYVNGYEKGWNEGYNEINSP